MATRQENIDMLVDAAMQKFNAGPLAREAEAAGWTEPLAAYARAMATYQAHLITRVHPNDRIVDFDPQPIFGDGFNSRLERCLPCATYQYQQWQREMMRECCHGSIVIRVPQDHYRRLIADGCALQNAAAASGGDV